jgi:hypothetical protein
MNRRLSALRIIVAAAAALLIAGCGSGAGNEQAAKDTDCLERWNDGAPEVFRTTLSLAGTSDEVLVGPYSGADFTTVGESPSGGGDRTVRPGDCVIARRGSLPEEWLVYFLGRESGKPAWYDISYDISDERHPLSRPTPSVFDGLVRASIVGLGSEAKLQPPG